jgi:hypothetical protein
MRLMSARDVGVLQIFVKLIVENRAAAATREVRALARYIGLSS